MQCLPPGLALVPLSSMSLNRCEQALFDYWERQPDERRHWQERLRELTRASFSPADTARGLERELWAHFEERSCHVPSLCEARGGGGRLSLLNLAELMIRLWGPLPKSKPAVEKARRG